ncbi:hypothetical protein [Agriterribacter sp.]|uniref:hypothetical protein n=1 Tax=Agriterribacter sp. TaxID=2821509 RepID=UPI002C6B8794|nr:hypothetical protein [Agriterribacter sp.]HRO45122.1 hypothetical protein [Agriterribacter sp.]HRQ15437.1 hypothetical protein [Agriterribacter sp.]
MRDQANPVSGVREIASPDIDTVYRTYKLKAEAKYSEYKIKSFEVVMISKLSDDGKNFLSKKRKPISDF